VLCSATEASAERKRVAVRERVLRAARRGGLRQKWVRRGGEKGVAQQMRRCGR